MLRVFRNIPCQLQNIIKTTPWGCPPSRLHSISSEIDTSVGSDGHYDIIIVGGGGAGISLAGAICK